MYLEREMFQDGKMRQEDEEEWRRVKRGLGIAALVVAGVVAAVLFLRTWLTPELPEIDEAAFIEPDVERPKDEDNAYFVFLSATNGLVWTRRVPYTGSREEWMDAVLASNAQTLAKIDAAMRLPAWYDVDSRRDWSCGINFMDRYEMQQLFSIWIKHEVYNGEIDEAVEHICGMFRLLDMMQEDSVSVSRSLDTLTAQRGVAMAACDVVSSGKTTDDQLSQLLRLLISLDDGQKALSRRRRTLANDYRYSFSPMMRRVENGEIDMSAVMSDTDEWIPRKGFAFSPSRTRVECADVYLRAAALLERDFDRDDWRNMRAEFEKERRRRMWLQLLLPNCGAWVVKMDKVDDLRLWAEQMSRFDWSSRMLEVIVAAELYRRRAGRYPAALEDLVPEFLPSVPVDPFDHGAPVKYDAQRGVIWTVGPNYECDGEDSNLWRMQHYVVPIAGKQPE